MASSWCIPFSTKFPYGIQSMAKVNPRKIRAIRTTENSRKRGIFILRGSRKRRSGCRRPSGFSLCRKFNEEQKLAAEKYLALLLVTFISNLKIIIQLYVQDSRRKSCIAQIE